MMRICTAGTAVLLALLAGCDQPQPEKPVEVTIDYAGKIATMPEASRNAVFIRALRGAELECQKVVHSQQSGTYEGMPLWAVACRDSGPWAVAIGHDGVAQIFKASPETP